MDQLFWLSTLVPGFALLQAYFRHTLRRGFLATLAWSFVLTVAAFTPIVIVAHLFHLTVLPVGCLYSALVLLGLIVVAKNFRWLSIRRLFRASHLSEILLLLVIITTIPIPGGVLYDAQMHSAKILYLRDVGFSLQDPYSPLEVIETKFHVNTYHALHAVGSWLTAVEPLDFWARSLWFFKVLALGAIQFLTFAVFRVRWASVIAMIGALWIIAPSESATLHQILAAYVVFPILLAQGIDLIDRETKKSYLQIAISSLALATIHVANWLLVALCVIPTLLGWSAWNRKRPQVWPRGVVATGAFLTGIPFLLITASMPSYIMEQMGSRFLYTMKTFVVTESWSFHMVPPARSLWVLPTATALLLLLTIAEHNRGKLLLLASVFFTACLYMFNPLFYEVLMRLIPYWIISRMNYLAQIVAFVVIPGGLAWMLRRTLRTARSRALLALTVLFCGLVLSYPRVKAHYRSVEKQHLRLARFEELRQALRPVLPERALVAADPEMSRLLPALRVSAVMAPVLGTANPADEGVLRRHEDCREFLADGTSDERRVALARQHGIAFVLIGTNWVDPPIFNSYRHESGFSFEGFSELVVEGDWFQLFRLRLDSSPTSGQA